MSASEVQTKRKRGTPQASPVAGEDVRSTDRRLNEAVAHLKFARIGPRKLRRVADAIRGKSVEEALVLLEFAGVFAAEPMQKLLKSAVANAGNNHDMNTDELFVTRVEVDGGPGGRFTKRLDPRAQGRAAFKRKRLSHVTIAVGEKPPVKKRKARGGASIGLKRATTRRTTAAAGSGTKAPAKRKAAGARKSTGARKTTAKKTAEAAS